MTLAAVAAALALPAGASAQPAAGNGAIAFSTFDDAKTISTIWADGSHKNVVRNGLMNATGTVGGWAGDGQSLAVIVPGETSVQQINPYSGELIRTYTDPGSRMLGAALSPDGTRVAYGTPSRGVGILGEDGVPQRLYDGASAGVAWANTDGLAWVHDEALDEYDAAGVMFSASISDNPAGPIHNTNYRADFPANLTISRDGAKVAYSVYGGGDTYDVYVSSSANSATPTTIPGIEHGDEINPAISPDGTKVAFASDRSGEWAIYTVRLDGTGLTKVPNTEQTGGVSISAITWGPAEAPNLVEVEPDGSTDLYGTLSPDPFEGSGSAPMTKSYKWQRCDDVAYPATNCVDIPGATNASYTSTAADLGKRIRYQRTWTNAAGTATAYSLVSDAVVETVPPDTTKPLAPTITGKPAAKSSDTEPQFTWTGAEAGGTYQCSLDNAAFTSCTSGDRVTITTEGPHRFRVRQTDAANNIGDPAEHTWDVDVTPPSNPHVTKQPNALTKSTTATIEFDGLDAGAHFECRSGKDLWATCSSPVELTGLTEGSQSFSIREVDAAGNVSDEPAFIDWEVDLTDPLAPTFGPNDPTVHVLSHTRTFSGEAGGTYSCQLDGGAWEACTSPATLTGYTSGPHTFRVRQTDDAGNTGPAGEEQFTADVTGPAAPTIAQPTPAAASKVDTATFAFTGNGATASFQCRLDDAAWTACTSPKAYADLGEGQHTFRVRGLNAGAIPGEPATHTWTVDTLRPAKPVVVKRPDAETTATGFADLTVAGEEGAARECSLDDATWTDCGPVLARTDLPLGPHELGIRLKDAAGNVSDFVVITWTIVAPKVAAPAEPVAPVTTPAPSPAPAPAPVPAPTVPRATAPAPKAETAAPAKPKLSALVGATDTPATGGGSGTASAAQIVVKEDGVGVGCSITGTVLTSCKVDLYVDRATGARAVAASRVLVGTGTVREAEGTKKLQVDVVLNATGRELMRRSPNGLKVKVDITGVPVKGDALKATGVATLVRQRTNATVGGFAVRSAKLTPAARRQLVKLARQVRGTAVAIRVVGHTDGSSQDDDYLSKLGRRRAAAVAQFLRAHGVKAKATLVSRGDKAPRATNATKAGRAQNRRVELRIVR